MAFLLTSVGFSGAARAHVTLALPRISFGMAFDWNRVSAARVAGRPIHPALMVTPAPEPAHHVEAAYNHAESLVRDAMPHYAPRDPAHVVLRRVDLAPLSSCFTSYGGLYGVSLSIQTKLLP